MRTQITPMNAPVPSRRPRVRGILVASAIVAALGIGGAGTAYAAGVDAAPGESTSPTPIEQITRGCHRMWNSACLWMGHGCSRDAGQTGSGCGPAMGGRVAIGMRAGSDANAKTPGTTTVRPGADTGYVDADGDGVCDHAQAYGAVSGSGYADANGDGVCDYAEADGQQTSTYSGRNTGTSNANSVELGRSAHDGERNNAGFGRGYGAGASGHVMGRSAL